MIPEEVRKEHMAICKNCKEREAVRRMVDFHVDWLDCFWDCPNDYEHWIAEQTERSEEMIKIVCDKCGREVYMKDPDLTRRAKIGYEKYDLCRDCIHEVTRFINQGKLDCNDEPQTERSE